MHVSALEPLYLTREEVPLELVEKEKEIFTKEMENQAKPAEVIEKIVEGKLSKWYSEIVLLEQAFIKDEDMTIDEFVKSKIASIGENITIRRFARFNI